MGDVAGPESLRIEKGIPPPPSQHQLTANNHRIREALRGLLAAEIGDSLLIPRDWFDDGTTIAHVAGRLAHRIGPGWYRIRQNNKGVRVWKVGERRE